MSYLMEVQRMIQTIRRIARKEFIFTYTIGAALEIQYPRVHFDWSLSQTLNLHFRHEVVRPHGYITPLVNTKELLYIFPFTS